MNAPVPDEHYTVSYRLALQDGRSFAYDVHINPDTLLSHVSEETAPAWAKLSVSQCPGCPLTDSEYCPVALRLAEPVRAFDGLLSHLPAHAEVITTERTYSRNGDVQDALRSLFGLIMATSGCPAMRPFRYMARYHLPFSTLEETVCRITSSYLIRRLFRPGDSGQFDTAITEIEQLFATMQRLNEGMANRLKGAAQGDGMINAVVILSTYSSLIPIILHQELEKLRPLFAE